MRELFSFCFEQITDPLALPLNPLAEWIILTVVHEIAYQLAFSKVGEYYRAGIIRGGTIGSALHWLFRGIIFIAFWVAINAVITVHMFITEHWKMILFATGGVALLAAVCILIKKIILQRRRVKVNSTVE